VTSAFTSFAVPASAQTNKLLQFVGELKTTSLEELFENDALNETADPPQRFSVRLSKDLPHHAEYGSPSPIRVEIERNVYGKLAWQF